MVGGFKYEIFKTSPTPSVHTSAKVSRAMPIDATIAARDDSTVVNAPLVLSAGVEITSLSDAKVYIHFFPPFSTPKGAGMKAKTGAIVDGTIGAAVLILLVGLLVWRVRRKEKRQWKPIEDPLRT